MYGILYEKWILYLFNDLCVNVIFFSLWSKLSNFDEKRSIISCNLSYLKLYLPMDCPGWMVLLSRNWNEKIMLIHSWKEYNFKSINVFSKCIWTFLRLRLHYGPAFLGSLFCFRRCCCCCRLVYFSFNMNVGYRISWYICA